jgi:hypothetical protein
MNNLNPFYIEKALDQIAGPVKNVSRFWDGSVLVETRSDDQSRKLLKQKLLGLYPVLVEKHNMLNSTRDVLSQVDGCSDEDIQAGLQNTVSKASRVHKKQERKLVPLIIPSHA